eukprot:gnl/MRDRNA2_/MRDRNA2_51648_c0_seq1.p1 gnl/MRDRNA2_/MRDRNA2_51648_c0~~gnl/MRDRNA2_/MRDRNA2_51648_c0_seq1.p1  ORF type:complete len:1106 (+),score=224.08 gnl/MRDRNA2_/MRDRNA2_51648_c0_seq1:54-3320(+)
MAAVTTGALSRAELGTTLNNIFAKSGRKSDAVSREKLQAILRLGDPSFSQNELDALFSCLGNSQNGCFSYKEFVRFLCSPDGGKDAAKESHQEPCQELASYFLGDYLHGGIFQGTHYQKTWDRTTSSHVLKHLPTGIQVWRDAVDLRAFGEGTVHVMFYYTSEIMFARIATKGIAKAAELYQELVEERTHFGNGLFVTKLEPAQFSTISGVLVNNYGAPELDPLNAPEQTSDISHRIHLSVRCVPILVPESIALSFRNSLKDTLHPNRDLWSIQVNASHMSGDAADALEHSSDLLRHTRTRRVSMLRKQGDVSTSVFEEMEGLAALLQTNEQPDVAEPLLREALEHREKSLGPDHPDTLTTMANLAVALEAQQNSEEAKPLYKAVMEGRIKALGPGHAETVDSIRAFASFLEKLGCTEEAETVRGRIETDSLNPGKKSIGDLTRYFLGDYLGGGSFHGAGYEKTWVRQCASAVLKHTSTGVLVWNDVIDLRPFGSGETQVFFHYTNESNFEKISRSSMTSAEVYHALAEVREPYGGGLFVTKLEPADFSNFTSILLNNYGAPETDPWAQKPQPPDLCQRVKEMWGPNSRNGNCAACCVPIFVPSNSTYCLHSSASVAGLLHTNRDIWIIHLKNIRSQSKGNNVKDDLVLHTRTRRVANLRRESGVSSLFFDELEGLAGLLQGRGKADEAEPLLRDALEHRKTVLGPEHADTLSTMVELAGVLELLKQSEEAEKLFRDVVDARLKVLGPADPETMSSMRKLATFLESINHLDEAETLHRDVIKKLRIQLGPGHPDVLSSMNSVANILEARGQIDDAVQLKWKVLEGRRDALGVWHSSTLSTMNDLASLLVYQGHLEEAEVIFWRCLKGYRKRLGAKHPSTLAILGNLAYLLKRRGELKQAEPLYREVVEVYREVYGPQHADTLQSINNLACLQVSRGCLEDAEGLFVEAVDGRRKVLGSQDLGTLTSISNLACLLQAQGRLEEAENLAQEALEGHRQKLGINHTETAMSLSNLASLMQAQNQLEKAESLYREALASRQKCLGNTHPETKQTVEMLADILKKSGRGDEADELLISVSFADSQPGSPGVTQ